VAAVLVVGAVVVAVALAGSGPKKNSAGAGASGTPVAGSGSPTSDQSTPSTAPTGDLSYTLNAPDQIGALKKAADQSEADSLKSSLQGANVGDAFAAEYQDTAAGNKPVIIWGATGGLFGILDAQSQLDSFFSGVGKSVAGGTVGTPTAVDPGSVGGTAECASVTGHVNATLCAWTSGDALVGAIFAGESLSQGGGQMHTVLPAVVTKK
jgi:hypothetical protein